MDIDWHKILSEKEKKKKKSMVDFNITWPKKKERNKIFSEKI